MRLSKRLSHIEPFYVMECAKAASELARSPVCDASRGGRPMIFLNIGEPDFTAPALVQEAAQRAIRDGNTQYTDAIGLQPLRERIARWYAQRFGIDIAPERIVVTAGASAALQLACLALIDPGDEVLLPDPSYPCNRNTGFKLPISANTGIGSGRAAAKSANARPARSDPVKPTPCVKGCCTSGPPITRPSPCNNEKTPGGIPLAAIARLMACATSSLVPGCASCALTTTGQPAASALAVSPPATE